MAFEYLPQTLKAQIQHKSSRMLPFSEKSLFKILHACCEALAYLDEKGISHDALSPYNILINAEKKSYKITDSRFMNATSLYQRFLLGSASEAECYLSPEQMRALRHRERSPFFSHQKSDVFALALSTLEAATLTSI